MKLKKNTINIMLVFSIILSIMIITFNISREAQLARLITERNEVCSDLSKELSLDESIEDCFCYYQGFKTGDSVFDEKTLPLCACDCHVNGTLVKVGLVEPKA